MIGWLSGIVKMVDNHHIILNVNGVGYTILSDYKAVIGEELEFYIDMQVKQEQVLLFGFSSIQKYKLFLLLLKINGLGGRMIIKIFEYFTLIDLKEILLSEQHVMLQSVSGIGDRMAKRIIAEVKKKDILTILQGIGANEKQVQRGKLVASANQHSIELDVISALNKLEINDEKKVLQCLNDIGIENYKDMTLDELIKQVLSVYYKGGK